MDLSKLLTLSDIEEAARTVLDPATWAYVAGGAGAGRTVDCNIAALDALWLRPRVLGTAFENPVTTVKILGQTLSFPVLLAPTSPQRLLHADAELATARAAVSSDIISIVSADSHYPFPQIAQTAGGNCWFQLYPYRNRAVVEATLDMAMEAGAKAVVVTIDAFFPARRISARRAGFRSPPEVDFGTLRLLGILSGASPADARIERLPLTWDDLEWIRARTKAPLLIKGILCPADARRCIEIGADGLIVSNHGGRQLDSAVPSLFALSEVASKVDGRCALLVDGGIRSGIDVVKALALGADAVCIGRPYLWGLGIGGEAGVKVVLELLRAEVVDTLRQLGIANIAEINLDCISQAQSPLAAHWADGSLEGSYAYDG